MPLNFNLKSIVRPNILSLEPYRCARDDYNEGILLDANENSYPFNLSSACLNRYPDPYQLSLKQKIMSYKKIDNVKKLFLGVGSDEVIDLVLRIFCIPSQDSILICPPTYGMYKVCAKINDVKVVTCPLLKEKFQLDVDNILKMLSSTPTIKVIFLCHPGNPTGSLLNLDDIEILLNSSFNGIVVVDEAYIDFVDSKYSCLNLLNLYPNLIVTQTLSKAFSAAGIRLGIAYSHTEIIQLMNNTKAPYNISCLTIEKGMEIFEPINLSTVSNNISKISESKQSLIKQVSDHPQLTLLGTSDANFLLMQVKNKDNNPCSNRAKEVYKYLADELKIVIRYRGNEMHCQGCLRATIGTEDENQKMLSGLFKALEKIE
ncbi:histidinol-phosphate aminotransferase [Neoconidiobolus thromboides FSU 785]|nr:histidinol-phosphate aminotransferase [Neoconidiobolus thromboides FSU 785]